MQAVRLAENRSRARARHTLVAAVEDALGFLF